MTILATALFLACAPTALLDFAVPKWKVDEAIRIDDAYKYLYQATRGGEHAAPDRESAKRWLDNEWRTLGPPSKISEPTWEALCPGGEVGRLHLRPFKAEGGKAGDLLDAFLASAREFKTEPSAFTEAWTKLGKRLAERRIGELDHRAWKKLDEEMRKKNYPAIHHSDGYNKARRPAYRVLTLSEVQKLIKN